MWKGWWRKAGTRFLLALAAAAYVGTGGVYYTFYACLVIWRRCSFGGSRPPVSSDVVARCGGRHSRAAVAGGIPRSPPCSDQNAIRLVGDYCDPLESLAYAGVSVSLVIPWPLRHMLFENREGEARYNILGSLAVVVSLGILLGLAATGSRSEEWPGRARIVEELTPWLLLMGWTTIWFIPGLGYAFAVLVSPNLRSWGRLSVVILDRHGDPWDLRGELLSHHPPLRTFMAGALGGLGPDAGGPGPSAASRAVGVGVRPRSSNLCREARGTRPRGLSDPSAPGHQIPGVPSEATPGDGTLRPHVDACIRADLSLELRSGGRVRALRSDARPIQREHAPRSAVGARS